LRLPIEALRKNGFLEEREGAKEWRCFLGGSAARMPERSKVSGEHEFPTRNKNSGRKKKRETAFLMG
jgi:hypothetical protein